MDLESQSVSQLVS